MQQDSLWASAPLPVSLSVTTHYDHTICRFQMVIGMTYSQKTEGKTVHHSAVKFDLDEKDVIEMLTYTAHRYFWKNRAPHRVEREVRLALASYRRRVEEDADRYAKADLVVMP